MMIIGIYNKSKKNSYIMVKDILILFMQLPVMFENSLMSLSLYYIYKYIDSGNYFLYY